MTNIGKNLMSMFWVFVVIVAIAASAVGYLIGYAVHQTSDKAPKQQINKIQ